MSPRTIKLVLQYDGTRWTLPHWRARQGAHDVAAAFDLRADGTVGFRVGT